MTLRIFHMGCCKNCLYRRKYKVALVGNPNVGKSSTFNMLSGKYAEVSNYPGTSVTVAWSKMDFGILIDTPGIYDLEEQTKVAEITRKHLENSDIVINVVNAMTIENDLLLTKQLLNQNYRVVLVINQVDQAKKHGRQINYDELSQQLNIPIIKTVATKRIGKAEIIREITSNGIDICGINTHSDNICLNNISALPPSNTFSKWDKFLLHPVFGWLVFIAILYILFIFLGIFVSGTIVDYLVEGMQQHYVPFVTSMVQRLFGSNIFSDILIGEFGILTMVIQSIIGILLPLITGFYIIMACLEDTGYIPRMAILTKKFFNIMGLNGDAVIPMLLGFGCGVMGTISTRILATRKERIIATSLIALTIPCAAQQGIIFSMLSKITSFGYWLAYIAIILGFMVISGVLIKQFIPGAITKFSMLLPTLRLPDMKNCYKKTFYRVRDFLLETFPVFSISSIFITILYKYGALVWLENKLSWLVENWLQLPKSFSDVFVMGIIRRDMSSLEVLNISQNLTNTQLFTSVVIISLFVPCINSIVVISKELGWRLAGVLWSTSFMISIVVGGLIARIF
ncbi:MAG: ferrous iron transporter B [Alphaproteobacteria bacterium]|nr:ferrous iron transporter B [Alphaproteobacteria bacterium]